MSKRMHLVDKVMVGEHYFNCLSIAWLKINLEAFGKEIDSLAVLGRLLFAIHVETMVGQCLAESGHSLVKSCS